MRIRRGRTAFAALVAFATVTALAAGGTTAAEAQSSLAKAKKPAAAKPFSISPVNLSTPTRSLGIAAKSIVMRTTNQGTTNVTLTQPDPYVRVVPVSGTPYFISAGELSQYFNALLGPAPTVGVTYGTKDRTRSVSLTEGVSAPVYDVTTQSMQFQALGTLDVVSAPNAAVTFIATDPTWRAPRTEGIKPGAITGKALSGRSGQADVSQSFAYDPNTFLSPTTPPTMLSATQQVFSGNKCVTYSGTPTTGGQTQSVSNLTVQSTSSDVSQSVKAGTSVSYKFGGLKTSMSASYAGSKTQDASSLYAVGTVAIDGIGTTLNPTLAYDATQVTDMNSAVQLIATCGDLVSTGYTSGAFYQAVLQMKTTSESAAQSLNASLSASYKEPGESTSGSASFAGAVSADNSVQNVDVTELCIGPSSCQAVQGYEPIDETSTTTALNSFSNNFAMMQIGLAGICQSPSTASSCVVNMVYAPIENLISGSLPNASTAKSLVSQASNGVYWLLNNTVDWSNQYQSLATAYSNAATYQDAGLAQYTLTSDQLNTQATSYANTASSLLTWAGQTCSGTQMGSTSCLTPMVNCSNVVLVTGTSSSACLPSSLASFSTVADPSTLAAPALTAPPQSCNAAVPTHASNDNEATTLYLGGNQGLPYPVDCVWSGGVASAFIPLTNATSQNDSGYTTFNYGLIDPSTGALYTLPASYPSNATAYKPTCTSSPCLPIGYAGTYSGSATHKLSVTLPTNLAFATTTNLMGSGNWTVNQPATRGTTSPTWNVSQPAQGGAQLYDTTYGDGVLMVVPANAKYAYTEPTTGQITVSSPAATSTCATSSSGKTTNSGDASNNVMNQQLNILGYVNGAPGACAAQLYEYNWKNNGASAWTDKSWFINSQWGAMYPTFICGTRSELNGQLMYKFDPSNPASLQVQWYADNSSKDDPTMAVYVDYDTINAPLASTNGNWAYVYGTCNYTDHPLQAGVSPL